MRVLIGCFSATGNTARIGEAIAARFRELGAEAVLRDVTRPDSRPPGLPLGGFEAVLFGSPIHSMRAPRVFREWLATLEGEGRKCATFFTYGGFLVHPTHHHTREILTGRGFEFVASAEFLGAHTYNLGGWEAMVGRPDSSDLELAREYASALYDRFNGSDPDVVGELDQGPHTLEFLDDIESFRFKLVHKLPTRDGAECRMCLLCETECPTGAMDAAEGKADRERCIVCLRCLKYCPDNALGINDLSRTFQGRLEKSGETVETFQRKKGRLYL